MRLVVCARNCPVNSRGFSPNELVFGKDPALPNLREEISILANRKNYTRGRDSLH